MQEVTFFFDDSGSLHKNEPSGFFVYAGFVFSDRQTLIEAKRKYIHANKELKKVLGRNDELKAATLKRNHRRMLLNAVREYDSLSAVVTIKKVYDYILANKKSICRYKDYVLKRCIKHKLKRLIANGVVLNSDDIRLRIYIDQQLTGTNGYYDLRDSIREELRHGIANFDYGIVHPSLFDSNVVVDIEYCNSQKNYMIQACDILANRIWNAFKGDDNGMKKIPNHTTLTFP
jgi:hypothetical protein